MFLGWFAVTGSERCGHGFNWRIVGICRLAVFSIYSRVIQGRVAAALQAPRHPGSEFFRSL